MRRFFAFCFVSIAIALTWLAWNPPAAQHTITRVHMPIPDIQNLEAGPWRVITRRMVWKTGVDSMQKRLLNAGFNPQLISKREPVELHAFDDPGIFLTESEAYKVKAKWRELGIEADVLHHLTKDDEQVFKVGLGRFYMSEYAESMQEELKRTKQPYNYERRTVNIPSYHFVFPAMTKSEAQVLWKHLQNMGIADPVIIQASEFEKLYANKSANLSNK